MADSSYSFRTARLRVEHCQQSTDVDGPALAAAVVDLMTEPVTRDLPPAWHGSFSVERAAAWIAEQLQEGPLLVVSEHSTTSVIGLMLLFEDREDRLGPMQIRLGYLLAESSWGQGYAGELIGGFVDLCRSRPEIGSVAGGVARTNEASRRVLEKHGFVAIESAAGSDTEVMFVLDLAR